MLTIAACIGWQRLTQKGEVMDQRSVPKTIALTLKYLGMEVAMLNVDEGLLDLYFSIPEVAL